MARLVLYAGRPGISPVVATLVALGRVHKGQRILGAGCGTGTEAILLAKWGFRRVEGIDPEPRAVATARARATRMRLHRRVAFHHAGAEGLASLYAAGTFDVVLHTLVANNLKKKRETHFRELARVLRRDGLLVLQERVTRRHENHRPNSMAPLTALKRHFRLTAGVSTHLPEFGAGPRSPDYARVILWLGSPRS